MRSQALHSRRAAAAVVMVIVLVLCSLVVVGLVLGGARDQDLTVRRVETLQAFYAVEAGANMAIREIMMNNDADGDGAIGTVSNDGNVNNDPAFASARVYVTTEAAGDQIELVSHGRSGVSARSATVLVDDAATGLAPGLQARYYSGLSNPSSVDTIDWSATPADTGVITQLNRPSASSSSVAGWPLGTNSNWAQRYTGKVTIPTTGTWTFSTTSDDGSKLWINGTQVVNNDGLHSMQTASGSIALTAGPHDIDIKWFERDGVHGLIVQWSGPGVSTTVIPSSVLTH